MDRRRNKRYIKSGNNKLDAANTLQYFSYKSILPYQSYLLHRFPEVTFLLSTTISAAKGLAPVYENQFTDEINVSQEEEGLNSDEKKSYTDKSKLFFRIWVINQCPLNKTFNVYKLLNSNMIKFWMSIWKPKYISKLHRILRKFTNKN